MFDRIYAIKSVSLFLPHSYSFRPFSVQNVLLFGLILLALNAGDLEDCIKLRRISVYPGWLFEVLQLVVEVLTEVNLDKDFIEIVDFVNHLHELYDFCVGN